jgi:hypothetical protein
MFAVGAASVTFGAIILTFNRVVKAIKFVKTAIAATQTAMLFFKAVIHGTNRAVYLAMLTKRQFTVATKLHAFGTKIATIAQQAWNWAVTKGTVVLDKLRYGVIGTTVKKSALAVASGVSTAAQWLWNGAVIAGRAVANFFTSGIILTGIKMGALAVWQGIVTVAQWLFNSALFACPVVWIIAAIMAIIAVVVLMVKYWDDIVAFFKGIWEGIKNIFYSVWEWIKNMFLNYTPYGLIIKHWAEISAWFGRLWENVKAVFVNAWNGIWEFFSVLPEKFSEIGQNIMRGLANGIMSAIKWVWSAIKKVAEGIGGSFSKLLGIASPSKLFAGFGMNITQGLVVGIDRGASDVESATDGLAMQTIGGYGQAVQAQTVPVAVGGGFGMADTSFNYSPTINIGAGVTEGTKDDFVKLLRQHYNEIVNIMQRSMENKARLSYNT